MVYVFAVTIIKSASLTQTVSTRFIRSWFVTIITITVLIISIIEMEWCLSPRPAILEICVVSATLQYQYVMSNNRFFLHLYSSPSFRIRVIICSKGSVVEVFVVVSQPLRTVVYGSWLNCQSQCETGTRKSRIFCVCSVHRPTTLCERI